MVIFEKFIKAINSSPIRLRSGERVVLAVSGGADSIALLRLFLEIRESRRLDLLVAHFNHQWRGKESDADEEFVKELAERYQLRCFTERASPEGQNSTSQRNFESWAREQRHDFLKRVASAHHANKIALGHTRNDQAETVLMRLMRGSGTLGLAAIPVLRDEMMIRPLLQVDREEILSYLKANHWEWREDSSNSDDRFLRNRIRWDLVPLLKEYNPRIIELLSNTASILREDAETLHELVKKVFAQEAVLQERRVVWQVPRLLGWSRGLQKNLFRHTLLELNQSLEFISSSHISAILTLLEDKKSGKCLEVGDVLISREYASLIFEKAKSEWKSPVKYDYHLPIPGRVRLTETGSLFEAFLDQPGGPRETLARWQFYLSPQQVTSGIRIRNWSAGDAYFPTGSAGVKKLKELFSRKKISGSLRRTWPVATIDDKIIFVKGFPVSADKSFKESAAITQKVVIEERTLKGETG